MARGSTMCAPSSRVLSGRFPDERLLSHDLIEGAHVRVGLASDIELLDEFPQDYLAWAKRQHRWIRGDWQIADWIMPRVPQPGGRRGANQLSAFNRWKILDNLRRSLVPAASIALLAVSWLTSSGMEWIATLVIVSQLFFQNFVQPLTSATSRQGLKRLSPSRIAHDLLRAVVEASLLPYQALLALNAILRVWYRRILSHRHMLEWTSIGMNRLSALSSFRSSFLHEGLISLPSAEWSAGRSTNGEKKSGKLARTRRSACSCRSMSTPACTGAKGSVDTTRGGWHSGPAR